MVAWNGCTKVRNQIRKTDEKGNEPRGGFPGRPKENRWRKLKSWKSAGTVFGGLFPPFPHSGHPREAYVFSCHVSLCYHTVTSRLAGISVGGYRHPVLWALPSDECTPRVNHNRRSDRLLCITSHTEPSLPKYPTCLSCPHFSIFFCPYNGQ